MLELYKNNKRREIIMLDIETQAFNTYQKNIEYLAQTHQEITTTLKAFERALSTGDYIPQYELEYIDGYFDVKDLNTSTYLYGSDSHEVSKELANRIKYQKDHFTFEGFPILNISPEALNELGDEAQLIAGILPLMRYYIQNSNESDLMKSIEKYIFIGTGLGMHIELTHKKISAKHYFIIEDNLELFKLSLFTTKYYELAKDSVLYFSIANDDSMFLSHMHTFLENDFFDNRHIKYTYFIKHSKNKIKQIQNVLTTQAFIFFPYKAELYKYLKPLEYINDGFNTINLITNIPTSLYHEKPSLVIGAGPSLKKHLSWLKNNHDKFVIIAASAIINTLYKNNITPDIVTHLDGSVETIKHYEDILKTDFLKNTVMFFGSNVHEEIRNIFTKEQIFFYEEGTDYFKGFSSVSTPCVGSFSVLLSLILNAKETYLIGLDLALNQETGETHSSEHLYNKKMDMGTKDEVKNTMSYINNFFKVEGNFVDYVYTNPLLNASIQSLYKHIPKMKQKMQTIYNLNDGAKINEAIPTNISDIDINKYPTIDKKELFKEAIKVFTNNSQQSLNEIDTASMRKRLTKANSIYDLITEYKNNVSRSNIDKYLYDLLGLVSSILHLQERESLNISFIFLQYFKYSLSISIDFFNTKGLKNEKRHIKKIDKMLQDEMFTICQIYIEKMEEFISKKI